MDVEPEEITKLIDGVYKNIVDKFNPCARQLIAAGKSYLKSLQNTNSACNVFNETLSKIATNAQQGTSSDVGKALSSIVNINRIIQEQHMNILKAFYVDLLMPLETNLEKDTKVIQSEQKKFLQQHKINLDNYCKAVAILKKQRKKKSSTGTTNKELKCLQNVEEEKKKLRKFCNNSFKAALTQERKRYGFVLERQCSIAKHWEIYHETGKNLIDKNLENWSQIASTRETFNQNIDEYFAKNLEATKDSSESMNLRKTRSMDVANTDMKSMNEKGGFNQNSLPRTKSEHNLIGTISNIDNGDDIFGQLSIVKAIYSYESAGKNQLSFEEGDYIALIGNHANGWQFGENLQTKLLGWFPETYVTVDSFTETNGHYQQQFNNSNNNNILATTLTRNQQQSQPDEGSPCRMFGDTILFRSTKYFQNISASDLRTSPPPILPPPVPSVSINQQNSSKDQYLMEQNRKTLINKSNKYTDSNDLHGRNKGNKNLPPPPQPEIDYSDEEVNLNRISLRQENDEMKSQNKTLSAESIDSNSNPKMDTINRKNNFIKRTKSFWRNKKLDESSSNELWQHKDIITKPKDEISTMKRKGSDTNNDEIANNVDTSKSYKIHNGKTHNSYDSSKDISNQEKAIYNYKLDHDHNNDDIDNDSDITLKVLDRNSFDDDDEDDNLTKKEMRKTVKRKEILKQYYSSGSETEKDTSDQYDCIVIDDHLVHNKMEFKTFNPNTASKNINKQNNNSKLPKNLSSMCTLLPRTKLNKSSKVNRDNPGIDSNSIISGNDKLDIDNSFSKAYGPWYDLWDHENTDLKHLHLQ